jgi:hypothetical protein
MQAMPERSVIPMAESGNQDGIIMWPSEAVAARAYDIANIALIAALVVGAIATVLVVWMGNVKEEYLKRDLAKVNNEAAQANVRAANADERASQADSKTEAEKIERLKLEALIAPRSLTIEQKQALANALKPFSGQSIIISSMPNDGEPLWLSSQIMDAATTAGLHPIDARGVYAAVSGFAFGISLSNGPNVALSKALKDFFHSIRQEPIIGGNVVDGLLSLPNLPVAKSAAVAIFVGTKPVPKPNER